ncbi:hypothetical protein PC128_g4508 [Phytophthora cactorum]|nr:hypothetical protein PC120_g14729 [Phytophthora cactorum]KAG3200566.1 hypothetical protein PC128_g4508 [Phytophthora cactorum]KAG4062226.1 hypothetical protein PC123_g2910 [Phytophthora cactorum]
MYDDCCLTKDFCSGYQSLSWLCKDWFPYERILVAGGRRATLRLKLGDD